VSDAPAYRIWPPVALGAPLLAGIAITASAGDPMYLGQITLDVALALLWGAVLPEKRYLSAKFGAEYDAYRARVRRWL
jgi:protein-S-isoprenylcysteine O-methyltransferase Ste14